jgi:hypothetical protein
VVVLADRNQGVPARLILLGDFDFKVCLGKFLSRPPHVRLQVVDNRYGLTGVSTVMVFIPDHLQIPP